MFPDLTVIREQGARTLIGLEASVYEGSAYLIFFVPLPSSTLHPVRKLLKGCQLKDV